MEERIYKILYEIRPDSDFVHSENFIEEGLLDSFDVMELLQQLEQEFDIHLDLGELEFENVASMEGIISLIGQ